VGRSVDVEEDTGRRLVPDALLPDWLRAVVQKVEGAPLPSWVLHATEAPPPDARRGAVLMLLAEGDDGPDLVITQRAATLRAHAGQPAFPGGALEPGEDDVAAALREAAEETAVDPSGVVPAAVLPRLYLPPSRFAVRPVLAHWRSPSEIRAVDPAETQRVLRVPVTTLADPANRGAVVLRTGGAGGLPRTFRSPAFRVGGLTVWGFTAGLVDLLLEWGGWSVPWDRNREMTP
jgi:8-oxo-dGTP pyrophosphatase MutT (NUDIX family)